jgi:hypothetical protein
MKRAFVTATMALAIYFLVAPDVARAAGTKAELLSLQGLAPVVRISTEKIREDAKLHGWRWQDFERDVELKIRLAGFRVVGEGDPEYHSTPWLYVNVNVIDQIADKMRPFNLSLHLRQDVKLLRSPHHTLIAVTTWNETIVGLGGLEYARSAMKDLVDKFLVDFLTANPKTR